MGKGRRKPRRPEALGAPLGNEIGPPGWGRLAALLATAHPRQDARVVVEYYRALAGKLAAGELSVDGANAETTAAVAGHLAAHAAATEAQLDHVVELLAWRRGEIATCRGIAADPTTSEDARRQAGARVAWLESDGWLAGCVADEQATALLSGVVLGILGARLGIEPALALARQGQSFDDGRREPKASPFTHWLDGKLAAHPYATWRQIVAMADDEAAAGGSVVVEVDSECRQITYKAKNGNEVDIGFESLQRKIRQRRAQRRAR